MDSLHMFSLPYWIPSNSLLPELWAIIFSWKWRLEMKVINKELLAYKKLQLKKNRVQEFCPFSNTKGYRGNIWTYKLNPKLSGHKAVHIGNKQTVIAYPRCGIKLIDIHPRHGLIIAYQIRYQYHNRLIPPTSVERALDWTKIMFKTGENGLYKHIIEDLGINCPPNIPCREMMKLLRTV